MSKRAKTQLGVTTMIARTAYKDLKPMQRYLLIQLSTYGDANGGSIYPSLKTLADITGMSRSTVQTHIEALVKLGYLTKISGGVIDGQNVSNEYQLNLEKLGFEVPENVVVGDFGGKEQQVKPDVRFMPADVAARFEQR